jgi:hypothetical protein
MRAASLSTQPDAVEDVKTVGRANGGECQAGAAGEICVVGVAQGHRGNSGQNGELVPRGGLGQEMSFATVGVGGPGLFGLRGGLGALRGLLDGVVTASDTGLA